MNLDFFNKMPESDKALFQECVDESIAEQRTIVSENDAIYLQACKDNGMTVVENPDLDSFKSATAGFGENEAIKALFDTSLITQVQEFLANNG